MGLFFKMAKILVFSLKLFPIMSKIKLLTNRKIKTIIYDFVLKYRPH